MMKSRATGFAFAKFIGVLVFAPMQARVRREILIQAQQILQEIDESEDQLDFFQNFDRPAYEAWLSSLFGKDVQRLSDLERECANYAQPSQPENSIHVEQTFAPPQLAAIEGEQLKIVYRKLVRRLHPDLQGPNADADELRWQKRIWNLSLAARERSDVREIERLYKVTLLRQMDFAELTIPEANDAHAWLTQELERLAAEVWQARQNPAWGFSKIQDLRPLAERSKQVLREEIQQREDELRELKSQKPSRRSRKRRTGLRGNEKQLSLFES